MTLNINYYGPENPPTNCNHGECGIGPFRVGFAVTIELAQYASEANHWAIISFPILAYGGPAISHTCHATEASADVLCVPADPFDAWPLSILPTSS